MASNRLEVLLTSESSGQMCNLALWDPATGSSLRSYKGNVTRSRTATLVGNSFLVSAQPSKPLLNVWQINRHEQRPLKYTTPGCLATLCASPCGNYLVGTNEQKIYLWHTASGKLLRIISNGHYQDITVTKFTSDGSHFITAGEDGNLLVWPLKDVADMAGSQGCKPRHSWSNHALAIADFHVGNGGIGARVFTASHDQTAKVFCLTSGQCLLEVSFSSVLTSITVDSAEERMFVGTKEGKIRDVCLKSPPRELTRVEEADSKDNTYLGHSKSVTQLSVSLDGLTLASGSDDHDLRLWHVKSRQCIRVLPHKGALTHVQFLVPLTGMVDNIQENFKVSHALPLLEKTVSTKNLAESNDFSMTIITNANEDEDFIEEVDTLDRMEEILRQDNRNQSSENGAQNGEKVDSSEMEKLKKINKALYQQAISGILKQSQ